MDKDMRIVYFLYAFFIIGSQKCIAGGNDISDIEQNINTKENIKALIMSKKKGIEYLALNKKDNRLIEISSAKQFFSLQKYGCLHKNPYLLKVANCSFVMSNGVEYITNKKIKDGQKLNYKNLDLEITYNLDIPSVEDINSIKLERIPNEGCDMIYNISNSSGSKKFGLMEILFIKPIF